MDPPPLKSYAELELELELEIELELELELVMHGRGASLLKDGVWHLRDGA